MKSRNRTINKWILAVTGLALAGIAIAGLVVVEEISERNKAAEKVSRAIRRATFDPVNVELAKEKLAVIERDLAELNIKISKAVNAVADAPNNADRAHARAQLAALQREQYEMKQRAAAAGKAVRPRVLPHNARCLANPFGKDCD